MLTSPAGADSEMSPELASRVILLSLEITMRPIFLPSSIVIVPFSSSKTTREPSRETRTRRSLPPPFFSGGRSLPFHSAPSTTGRLMSPCSNMTSTSSSTSGRNHQPRSLPAPSAASGAHQEVSWPGRVGKRTLIRPSLSGSLLSTTRPTIGS
jgi:hypothetical protein